MPALDPSQQQQQQQMDKGANSPDFVKKLFTMLEEQEYENIVRWNSLGDSFIVLDVCRPHAGRIRDESLQGSGRCCCIETVLLTSRPMNSQKRSSRAISSIPTLPHSSDSSISMDICYLERC
jgi:hypothetical protein